MGRVRGGVKVRRGPLGAALALAAALAAPGFAYAAAAKPAPKPQAASRPVEIGRSYTLRSRVLGDLRRINVYLPDSYASSPGRRFPVLFLLDGGEREDFHHITGLAQINAAYGQGQELIVVGIEGVDRRHDLTPPSQVPSDLKAAPTSGGRAAYLRFLTQELKPWVAARWRTDGRDAIIGESLAGLFVLQTLLEQPQSFDDYIAVSPSLWWNAGALSRAAAGDLAAHDYAGRRAWIAFDDPAPPADVAARERALQDQVERAFRDGRPAGLTWTVTRPGEGHASIYHLAALQALRGLFGKAE